MSSRTTQLLEAFEALENEEKSTFANEVLRRALPFGSAPLEDFEIAAPSDALFAALEDEEDAAHSG